MSVDAVLLASFGGPEGPDEVMPFLERVTAGRGVPRERLEEVSQHYLALGGVSPINAQNRELLAALRTELASRGIELPVYWGNRNSAPFFADALREIAADGHRRVLALATSAYSSYSGCRQYRENLAAALAEAAVADRLEVLKARPYFHRTGFVTPFAAGVAAALEETAAAGMSDDDVRIVFTTHSIPASMALGSGPQASAELPGAYERQHLEVARCVIDEVERRRGRPAPAWSLAFQSRSGPPQVPWLEPDIGDVLRELAGAGARAAVVVPIGFISDHVEVVWDLDTEARDIADGLGLLMVRVATPGTDPAFVAALADVVADALVGTSDPADAGLCSVGCCPNARGELPTVAGA